MTDKENETPMESAEELEAEKNYIAEVKEDDVRDEIIKEFGFDPDEDKERIDKAVKRELDSRSKLSKAVGQKIKYREGLTKATAEKDTSKKTDTSKKDDDADLDAKLDARLDARDLAEMEYPDDLKKVIEQVAKINGIRVKEAVKDPYVAAKIEAWKKEQGSDEAALSSRDKTSSGKNSEDVDLTPPDVDLDTKEGREEYDAWKKKMIAAGH